MPQDKLIELLSLRHSGVPPRDIYRLFDPDPLAPELPLGLPSPLTGYHEELQAGLAQARTELATCQQLGISILPFFAPTYPRSLFDLGSERPLVLYALGSAALLERTGECTTIIGTRTPSPAALREAHLRARLLASRGRIIVSGMALGCDSAALWGALEIQAPAIAVVATGLDSVYPASNQPLQQKILRHGGLILSEYPPSTPVAPFRLVARDRLQAALSAETILIESGLSGGSMHTIRYAEGCRRRIYALRWQEENAQNAAGRALLSQHRALPLEPL